MENTEITLNGRDWSNLYIIDYSGGCGGEKMCDYLSEKIDAQFTIPQSLTQSFTIDSFSNLYVTTQLDTTRGDIKQYKGYKDRETDSDTHSEDTMKHNLKVNLIHRDKDISWHMRFSTEDERDSLVRDTYFTKNYILRSHRNIDWSSFTNAKVIRIYPWLDSHIPYSLMMLKRWVKLDPDFSKFPSRFLSDDTLEWVKCNVFSETPGILYSWQHELLIADRLQDFNWSSFVDDRFAYAEIDEMAPNSISGTEWTFGTSDVPITIVKDITEIDIMSTDLVAWQQSNIDLLAQHGISMTSTKEECITYFKNYWDINNIPCVTEI